MGHERMGLLPKSQPWREIVDAIAQLPEGDADVSQIADQTIRNVHMQFRRVGDDEGVKAAFGFLLALATASRSDEPVSRLKAVGIDVPDKPTPLSFAKALRTWMSREQQSLEYGQLAHGAGVDAIATWYEQNKDANVRLFDPPDAGFDTWRKAGTGAGFCQLSRLFFSRLTERYLNYFLEREASAALKGVDERDRFARELHEHVDAVSQHAFETARIAQSFAAGWFNKYARDRRPSSREIDSFLAFAFGKIAEELVRETSHP